MVRNQSTFKKLIFALVLIFGLQTYGFPFFGSSPDKPPSEVPPLPTSTMDFTSYISTLDRSEDHCSDHACHLWHQYIRAKFTTQNDKIKGCKIFQDLTSENHFPLYPFVLIRGADACRDNPSVEADLVEKLKKYIKQEKPPIWLEEELRQGAATATLALNRDEYFENMAMAVQLAKNRKAKVDLLQSLVKEALKKAHPRLKEFQEELYDLAPRFQPVPNDWSLAGHDALINHDYDFAVKALEQAIKKKHGLKFSVFEDLKLAYKGAQKKKEALRTALREWKTESQLLTQKKLNNEALKQILSSGLGYVKALWTEHQDKMALAALSNIEKRIAGRVNTSEIAFVRGKIFEEERNIPQAFVWLKKAWSNAPDLQTKSSYAWNLGWLQFKSKKWADAKAVFENMIPTEKDLGKHSQETYWLGQTLIKLNNPAEAQHWFEKLTQDDPFGYYGLLAFRELKKPIPTFIPATTSETVSGQTKNRDWTAFDWLVSTGELEWARDFLDREVPMGEGLPDKWENLFLKYAQADYYAPIFIRIPKLTPADKVTLIEKHGDLVFPRKWTEYVNHASWRSGLWPEFILSIIRQESSFDPLAISGANAYGLMQLLPSIARVIDGKVKISKGGKIDLLDPESNIILGSQLLRHDWDLFNGQFILAVATYNAGDEIVRKWIKTRYRGNPVSFVEDIPYEETRIYVKLVLRNFINYQRMSTSNPYISFPDWCFDPFQVSKK